jgi:CIC family chloride channel protein
MFYFQPQTRKALKHIILAVVVGLCGGVGAIIFRFMISINRKIFFQWFLNLVSINISNWNLGIILLPVIGALIVGPIISRVAIETKGHGVPEVMEAVHLYGGKIRSRVAFIKVLVSSITIGSGGSAGREGPIAQIGSSLGSLIAQKLNLSERYRKLLVGCGMASGIGATFNAPLGGALFSMEVLMKEYNAISATAIILSSVVGTTFASIWLGSSPAFHLFKPLEFNHPLELIFYLLMGLIFGILSVIWVKTFYKIEDFFDNKVKIPLSLKPALGGFFTGILGVFTISYGILGVGYEGIDLALAGKLSLTLLITLGILKILSTSFTIGSGGSGGIFAPSLFIGAMFGGAFGILFNFFFPQIAITPMTYALVGMGALFAGAANAPLTCIVMIPEMTRDYSLLPAMMAACVSSYLISFVFMKDNIYTLKLLRRGVSLDTDNILSEIRVKDVMTKKVETLESKMKVHELIKLMLKEGHGHMGYPVMKNNKLFGIITFDDIQDSDTDESIEELCTRNVITIYPKNTVQKAVRLMQEYGIGRLIVVDEEDKDKILGIISRTDILKAYNQMVKLKREL